MSMERSLHFVKGRYTFDSNIQLLSPCRIIGDHPKTHWETPSWNLNCLIYSFQIAPFHSWIESVCRSFVHVGQLAGFECIPKQSQAMQDTNKRCLHSTFLMSVLSPSYLIIVGIRISSSASNPISPRKINHLLTWPSLQKHIHSDFSFMGEARYKERFIFQSQVSAFHFFSIWPLLYENVFST